MQVRLRLPRHFESVVSLARDRILERRDAIPRARWFAWWYLSIGLGFLLLAVRTAIAAAPFWQVGLRLVIAVGFFLLAYAQFRSAGPQGR